MWQVFLSTASYRKPRADEVAAEDLECPVDYVPLNMDEVPIHSHQRACVPVMLSGGECRSSPLRHSGACP